LGEEQKDDLESFTFEGFLLCTSCPVQTPLDLFIVLRANKSPFQHDVITSVVIHGVAL
jgi:hypothetical protein